jgi:CRISPR-associated endonuclease/helicase Cas3
MLWRSARVLLAAGAIETPGNVRALVEAAVEDAVPAAFETASQRSEARRLSRRALAAQNVLVFHHPYDRNAGAWEPDIRTPTRIEEDRRMTLRLALLRDGCAVPVCTDASPARAWALSEVSVRLAQADAVAPDPEADRLLEAVRDDWKNWELEVPVLLLRGPPEGPWSGSLLCRGEERGATYDRRRGLLIRTLELF